MSDLTPITREEALLDGADLEPITRKEQFIKRIYDKTQEVPEPITREEWFLKKAGEGTSPVTIEQLNATENGTYSEPGKAYSPVIVEVPQTTVESLNITANGTYTAPSGKAYSPVTVNVEGFKKKSIANTPTDIASFDDGTANPMPSLEISIEPQQDLHGYDNPWVGGAGKNKIDVPNGKVTSAGYIFNLVDLNLPAGTYTLSGQSNPALQQAITSFAVVTGSTTPINRSISTPFTFTVENNITGMRLYITTSCEYYNIQLEEGSTATSYSPYSNICPISGWSGAKIANDAEYGGFINWNQLVRNGDFANGTTGWNTQNGTLTVNNSIATATANINGNVSVGRNDYNIPNNHVIISFATVKGISGKKFVFSSMTNSQEFNATGNYQAIKYVEKASTYSIGYPRVLCKALEINDTFDIKYFNIIDLTAVFGTTIADYIYSLEQATAGAGVAYFRNLFPHDYYPYNAGEITTVSAVNGDVDKYSIIPIPFHDSSDNPITVYGGRLNVTSGSCLKYESAINLSSIDSFGSDEVNASGYIRYNCAVSDKAHNYNIMCDKMRVVNITVPQDASSEMISGSATNNKLYFTINSTRLTGDLSTASGRRQALNTLLQTDDIQVAYELATPQTYQLTPAQVSTLLGQNNIFADCGQILEGEYFVTL